MFGESALCPQSVTKSVINCKAGLRMYLFIKHLKDPVSICNPFWIYISSSSERSSLTSRVFFLGQRQSLLVDLTGFQPTLLVSKDTENPGNGAELLAAVIEMLFICSTGAKVIFPGVIRVNLCLCNHLVSFTFAPMFSGQTGEELQDPNLMFHSGLLPPLLPLRHLPLPALLPLQPLCQELLMPASLILPLILQLHKEAPRVRHQPLEAVR